MRMSGNHQTTYADWARAVITHYPYDLTYKLNEETDTVHVFYEENEIAHYDFGHGTGEMVDTEQRKITDMGKWDSFEEINIDNLLHV
jgi:hypothetical protein